MPSRVTVGIITNGRRIDALNACLDSIEKQDFPKDFPNKQIAILEHRNNDSTTEVREIAEKRGIVYDFQYTGGIGNLRNGMIRLAEKIGTTYLVYTDDDCIADREWLKEMVKPFETGKVSAVVGRCFGDNSPRYVRSPSMLPFYGYLRNAMWKNMLSDEKIGEYPVIKWGMGFNMAHYMEILKEVRFSPDIIFNGEDQEIIFRLFSNREKFDKVPVFNERAIVNHRPDTRRMGQSETYIQTARSIRTLKEMHGYEVFGGVIPYTLEKLHCVLQVIFSGDLKSLSKVLSY